MAVDLSKLVVKRQMSLEELNGRVIAIDAYNVLYQFLTTIRQRDGSPLMDSSGNVTSHLSGLFYRTIDLISQGARPVYVFDGLPSVLKRKALEARTRRREAAYEAWQHARKEGNLEEARAMAQRSATVNKEIVGSARELLSLMGVYCISAPSEGEAQASVMCKKGIVDMVASQDYDTLLLGAPLIARNVTVSGRRKLPGKDIYVDVKPELVDLAKTLSSLGITQRQLVWIGIMLGTDFNSGIRGVGPKTALKIALAAKSSRDIVSIARDKYKQEFDVPIDEVIEMFEKPETSDIRKREFLGNLNLSPDRDALMRFMCERHGFSADRIGRYADRLVSSADSRKQRSLFH